MREELLKTLRRASRRLLLTRAGEAAAVGAAAAGLCAAMLELAWMVAGELPLLGWTLCAAAAALGMSIGAIPAVRRKLRIDKLLSWLAAGVCVASAGAAAALVLAGLHGHLPRGLLPAIAMPAGAIAGAAAVLARGVSLRAAAIYLDVRAGTGERLSTALELAESDQADAPPARCLYAQAVKAADETRAARLPLWRRTRATPGALGLVVVLCGALAMLPPLERRRAAPAGAAGVSRPAAGRFVQAPAASSVAKIVSLAQMTTEQRVRFADALRRAAAAEKDPAKARALRDAAAAIEAGDADALAAVLEKAPAAAAEVLGRAEAEEPAAAPGRVAVYAPEYAKALAAGKGAAGGGEGGADVERGMVPRDDAWSAARRKAVEAIARAEVPPQYRQLVYDFFVRAD